MTGEKQLLARNIQERRRLALSLVKPQWTACERMKPKGHIYDGSGGKGVLLPECLYCGCPQGYDFDLSVLELEGCASVKQSWPIANGLAKAVAA